MELPTGILSNIIHRIYSQEDANQHNNGAYVTKTSKFLSETCVKNVFCWYNQLNCYRQNVNVIVSVNQKFY